MSITNPRVLHTSTIEASPAAATETAVCEVDGIATRPGGSTVALSAAVSLTVGTTGASVQLRIRRGSGTGGTLVADTGAVNATAGTIVAVPINGQDSPGEVAGESYTLTVTVASATAASTVHQAGLTATY